jgi:signal transduction histidine kinase
LEPDALELLAKISRNADQMQHLINDLLALSRVARAEVTMEFVPLRAIISRVIEQNPAFQPPRALIELGPVADVIGNPVLLSQAVSNILGNAVKFVAPGTIPKVRIWSEPREDRVRLWVEDNGIGIPRELQGKLFAMFERLNQNPAYDGTGIGLAIVRKSMARMGGAVGVESDGKSGSRFWLEFKGEEAREETDLQI